MALRNQPFSTWRHAVTTAITPGRLGFLAAIAAIQATRNIATTAMEASALETLRAYAVFSAIHFFSDLPYLYIVAVAEQASRAWRVRRRGLLLVTVVILGSMVYAVCYAFAFEFGSAAANYPWPGLWRSQEAATLNLVAFWIRGLVYGGLLTGILYFVVRRHQAEESVLRLEAERGALAKQVLEADLLVLQAQIEPHFLFNTLANVRRLYLTDPSGGSELLANLTSYFRATLPRMREGAPTLGREIDLVRAYLNVLRTRMGSRLQFEIDVPAGLRELRVPPLILITLVENAVKHGVGPLAEGGHIHLGASLARSRVRLWVSDTGRGFAKVMGEGIGLANIRSRLRVLYGTDASLALERNSFGGITASIELPVTQGGISAEPAPA